MGYDVEWNWLSIASDYGMPQQRRHRSVFILADLSLDPQVEQSTLVR